MKPWQTFLLCAALLVGFVGHAAANRYEVASHPFGGITLMVKLDRWTGKTWRYTPSIGWSEMSADAYAGLGAPAKP